MGSPPQLLLREGTEKERERNAHLIFHVDVVDDEDDDDGGGDRHRRIAERLWSNMVCAPELLLLLLLLLLQYIVGSVVDGQRTNERGRHHVANIIIRECVLVLFNRRPWPNVRRARRIRNARVSPSRIES